MTSPAINTLTDEPVQRGWFSVAQLDAIRGELSDEQWQDLRAYLRADHHVPAHNPATYYELARRGCPHGLAEKLADSDDAFDFDPDTWLDATGVADQHFWDEDGDLYCMSLPSAELGCEECETSPCMLPEQRAEQRQEFWYLVSRERVVLDEHQAQHGRCLVSDKWDCPHCKTDYETDQIIRSLDEGRR